MGPGGSRPVRTVTGPVSGGAVASRVKSVIARVFDLDEDAEAALAADQSLFTSQMRADSLLIQALIASLESEFGYPLDEGLMVRTGFETVSDVVRIVELSADQR